MKKKAKSKSFMFPRRKLRYTSHQKLLANWIACAVFDASYEVEGYFEMSSPLIYSTPDFGKSLLSSAKKLEKLMQEEN